MESSVEFIGLDMSLTNRTRSVDENSELYNSNYPGQWIKPWPISVYDAKFFRNLYDNYGSLLLKKCMKETDLL